MDPEIVEFLKAVNARPEMDLRALAPQEALKLMRSNSLTTDPGTEQASRSGTCGSRDPTVQFQSGCTCLSLRGLAR